MFQSPYARLRISCRLCISAAVCSMRNIGTRNAGISSSGSVAIGAVLISPGAPVVSAALNVPMLRATMRSSMPSTFQRMNAALVLLRKAFEYGTLVWLLRASGLKYWSAGVWVGAGLLLLEKAA